MMAHRIGISLAVLALALGGAWLLGDTPAQAQQSVSYSLEGWAWSDTIGWISFSCEDGGPRGSGICERSPYGVSVTPTGVLVGEAWSDNLGWIQVGASGCPEGNCVTKVEDGKFSGWLRALSGSTLQSGGWDGWISLSGPRYGVRVANGDVSGFAWGDINVGWVDFSRVRLQAACNNGLSYDLYGPSCTCPEGQAQSGSVCIARLCTGAHEEPDTYPTCACVAGYEKLNGACVVKKPTLELHAPSLVRMNTQAAISWSVQGLPFDGAVACNIGSSPTVFSRSYPLGTEGTQWTGSGQTAPIESQTIITLSCATDSGRFMGSVSHTISLIPQFNEI